MCVFCECYNIDVESRIKRTWKLLKYSFSSLATCRGCRCLGYSWWRITSKVIYAVEVQLNSSPCIACCALDNVHKQTSCIWYVLMCPFCEPWMWHFCTILKLCVILSYACMKAYKICEHACMVRSPVVLPTSTCSRKVHVTTVQTNVRYKQRELQNNYQGVIQETGQRQGRLLNAPTSIVLSNLCTLQRYCAVQLTC